MTTSLYKLRNEYGLTPRVMSLLSAMMSKGQLEFQLRVVSLKVEPINGNAYEKRNKARVFDMDSAMEAVLKKPPRNYTVSVHQANLDNELRETAFAELSKIMKTIKKEES